MTNLYEKLMSRMAPELKPAGPADVKKASAKIWDFAPFITFSREPGSGGRPIAKKIAKLTSFAYYHDALVEKVAKTAHLRQGILKRIDEKSRSAIQDFVHSLFNPDYVSDVKYVHQLAHVIMSLAEKGNVILVGHGANFITSLKRGLHVRISAPYPIRVSRAVKFEKISPHKAREVIKTVDADRKNFISQYFGKGISNANYYDLVLNTHYLSIDDACDIILKAFERKFPGYLHHYKVMSKRERG